MDAMHTSYTTIWLAVMQCLLFLTHSVYGGATQMTANNMEYIIKNNDIVLVNFYADWCRFSQILKPIFDDSADKVKAEFPRGKVEFAKVDCDKESGTAAQHHVNKYPTIKIFRNGQLVKREYRGQRSVDALTNFIREQLKDTIQDVGDLEDLDTIDIKKRHIIGYFDNENGEEYKHFQRTASQLREDCQFHKAIGPISQKERIAGDKMVFRPPGENPTEMTYSGILKDPQLILAWATDKCVPLVREITFENAEELTEEGLPFLILFHNPDDTTTPDLYRKAVAKDLLTEKSNINFLTADGLKFSHPLFHLGKTTNDLPILAIDSFRHMYLWKHDPKENLDKPKLLKEFLSDLHSGKLHREFHHGPDPGEKKPDVTPSADEDKHVKKQENGDDKPKKPTSPPESLFKKLAPSRSRYTLLRDEL